MQVLVEVVDPAVAAEEYISNPIQVEVCQGTTLSQLGERLQLPPELSHLGLVNREIKSGDYVLQEGDYIAFFSSYEGPECDIPILSDERRGG
ncbi:MAG: hypothetical protein HPY50_09150 [Firmicutes bacterium]|nr:hypothetical protein [Bacillota bacterium]